MIEVSQFRSQRLIAGLLSLLMVLSMFGSYPVQTAEGRSLSPTEYAAGASPYSVAIGDLNGDGLQDVAVTNFTGGNVGVYFQQPSGALGAMTVLPSPPLPYNYGSFLPNPYGLKIVDFDNDGLKDLIVTNEFQHQLWIYRQGVPGLYLYQLVNTPNIETHPYSSPYSVDAADLGGDGFAEIAAANYFWKDAGPTDLGSVGLFNNRPTAANNLYDVSFVDQDNGWISGDHTVYGTLTGGWNTLTGTGLWDAQYLPLDDSIDAELRAQIRSIDFVDSGFGVSVGTDGLVMKSDSGGFSWDKAEAVGVATDLNAVDMADRKNGRAVGVGGTSILTTDGGNTWTDVSATGFTANLRGAANVGGSSSGSWVVGENGAIAYYVNYEIATMPVPSSPVTSENLNDVDFSGSEGWIVGDFGTILESVTATSSVSWTPQASGVTEDLNGVDFVSASTGWAVGNAGTILKTTDGGASWLPQNSGTLADLNSVSFAGSSNGWAVGDGGVILTTSDGGLNWFYQGFSGSRSFSSMFNYPMDGSAAFNPYAAKIGDINNDGKNDITVAASNGKMTNFRIGLHTGGSALLLSSKQTVATGQLPADMAFLDYNNDGRPDVATSNNLSNSISILTQPILPTNGFETAVTLETGSHPLGIEAADINEDGLQDLVVANSDSNSISVFTKQAMNGPFNAPAVFSTSGSGPYGLAIGDVDGDGLNEIVVADSSPNGGNKIEIFQPTGAPGAPTVVSSTHPDSTVYYNNNKPQFQISPPADIDGIDGYYWRIDSSTDTVPNAADNFSLSGSVNLLSGLADGDYFFHAVAEDSKGNIGLAANEAAHYPFKINSTPLIPTIMSPGDGTTISGTINVDATVTTSPLFSITQVEVYIDNATVPATVLTTSPYNYSLDTTTLSNGSHTIKITATDTGNRQASDTNTVNVDNTAGGGGGNNNGITRSSIVLTGNQFNTGSTGVSGLTYFDSSNDSWNSVGYFAPGATVGTAIYEFNLPAPNGYLWQQLTIAEDAAMASGANAKFTAYNWASGAWETVAASGELPFWFIQPGVNKVRVKVEAPAWSVHQINSLTLEYKYQSDASAPLITAVDGSDVNFANPYFSRLSFSLNEKAFLAVNITDSGGTIIKQYNTAKQEGLPAIYWDLTDNFGNFVAPGTYYYQVSATDIAGNSSISPIGPISYRATTIVPSQISSLAGWDWSRSKAVEGDFNNDGLSDIAILFNVGGNQSILYQLTNTGASFSVTGVWNSGAGNWSWDATNLAAGDFNGDNRDDVAAVYGYGGAQTRAFIFASNGATLDPPVSWWDSGPGNWEMAGSKLTVGDFNGDGNDDLGVLYGYSSTRQSRAWVFQANGAGTAFQSPQIWWDSGPGNWDWDGSKLLSGDFNGDGNSDLGVFYGYAGARSKLWVFRSNVTGFNPPGVWWDSGAGNWDWNASQLMTGDYNGDGVADVAVAYTYGGARTGIFGFVSNTAAFNQPVSLWDSGAGNWDGNQSNFLGGNYNGDSVDDVSILYNYGSFTGIWTFYM